MSVDDSFALGDGDGAPPPPLVPAWPIVGSAWQLHHEPRLFFADNFRRFGPIFRFRVLNKSATVLAGPKATAFFLEHGAEYLRRRNLLLSVSRDIGTENFILATDGEVHRHYGKLMRVCFSREVVAPHLPQMVEAAHRLAASWRPGQRIDVVDAMSKLALEQMAFPLTGAPFEGAFDDMRRFSNTLISVALGLRPPFSFRLPGYRSVKDRLLAVARAAIDRHRNDTSGRDRALDVVDALLAARDASGRPLGDEEMLATTLFGSLTSLAYLGRLYATLVYLLLKHPDRLEAVLAEVDRHTSRDGLSAVSLRRMSLLRGAYMEALRLYPIALAIPMEAGRRFAFEGHRVEKGDRVLVCMAVSHFYDHCFKDPFAFEPERHLAPRFESQQRGAFVPFGLSPRFCPAVGLTEMVTMASVATLLGTARAALAPEDYSLRTVLSPLPGPEAGFRVRVVGPRPIAVRTRPPAPQEEELAANLPSAGRRQLADAAARSRFQHYASGVAIVSQGDPAEEFFILAEGEAEVLRSQQGEEPARIARLTAGDYFGEIGLLHGVPRTATVRAAGAAGARVIALPRDAFSALVVESDLLSDEVSALVQRRVTLNLLLEALPGLAADAAKRQLAEFQPRRFEPGAQVFGQGEAADAFYVIVEGRAEVLAIGPDGDDVKIGDLERGEYFGEIGLLRRTPRMATIRAAAAGPLETLMLGREAFLSFLAASPGATRSMSRAVLMRLGETRL